MDESYLSTDRACDLELVDCEAPQLEASQDLDLLAQEIAEAAVEDEKRSSGTPSPTPLTSNTVPTEQTQDTSHTETNTTHTTTEELDTAEQNKDVTDFPENKDEEPRCSSPVDEASWVMIDAVEQEELPPELEGDPSAPQQRFSVSRKFLARGDLRQKLAHLGLVCEDHQDETKQQEVSSPDDMVVSSDSMVICDLPQEDGEEDTEKAEFEPSEVFLKDPLEAPPLPGWRGTFSGATVSVSVERQGGLLVAGVKLWHVDLLSALTSLRHLVSSAGLISYADVDVPSLLARAA